MNENEAFDDVVTPPDGTPDVPPAESFPWPPSDGQSAIDALGRTWFQSVFHPVRFFRAMPPEGSMGPAILYALILGVAGAGMRLFWSYMIPAAASVQDMSQEEILQHPFAVIASSMHYGVTQFLMSPLIIVLALLLGAAILHLFVLMLIRDHGPYERTLRMMCYAMGPTLFFIVPFAGLVVAGIWGLVIRIIGVREVHRTTTGRAIATYAVPCGCVVLIAFVIGIIAAVVGASFMSQMAK